LLHDTIRRKTLQNRAVFEHSQSISVIVPVLNEERRIEGVIGSLRAEPDIVEIIVVDGGSDDRTREKARRTGVKVLSGVRGRGHQVNAGIAHAHGDVILVLHADTVLLAGSIEHMLKALQTFPSAPGGAFKMTFEGQSCRLRLVAWLNNVRAGWMGISFGDQGQFFRREALAAIGGIPEMMLMEDVELSMRMKRLARPLFIKPGVRVSTRRWQRTEFFGNVGKVLKLFLRYLLERRFYGFEGIRGDYYGEYYRR
jgi:rSAM/selenodomain-associated transferase 2